MSPLALVPLPSVQDCGRDLIRRAESDDHRHKLCSLLHAGGARYVTFRLKKGRLHHLNGAIERGALSRRGADEGRGELSLLTGR